MNFSNKKILFGIIIILIIAAGAILYWQWQKPAVPPDTSEPSVLSPEELEELRLMCLEDVSGMDEKQIIEEISVLAFAGNVNWGKLNRKPNILMSRHLRCQFSRDPFEEQYIKSRSLIELLKISDETSSGILSWLDSTWSFWQKLDKELSYPTIKIVVYNKERLCPNGEEKPELVEELIKVAIESGHPREKTESILSSYCDQISKYSENEYDLTNEIYEFKDWPEDPEERQFEYRWKAILAFRFGGKVKSEQVCSNLLNEDEKEDCEEVVGNIYSWPGVSEIYEKCTGTEIEEVKDLICGLEVAK